jgi:RNA polymerase sigma-70 factor, ECF subfamily
MISVVGAKEEQCESESRTLRDLLDIDKTKVLVSERDWIRLVESVAAGNQLALHSLYERAHRIVFTLILRITKNRETAEEVTVDVFYDVWRRASVYDPADGSVVGWIMNQARCQAIDRLRFEHRKRRFNNQVHVPFTASVANDAEWACRLEEQGRYLRTAIDEVLTPEERRVIETAFFSELTYQEVAVRLNQPV